MHQVDRSKLQQLIDAESQMFIDRHPKAKRLFEKARSSLLDGVPMPWMTEWASPFPLYIQKASGAHFTDVDGLEYIDF